MKKILIVLAVLFLIVGCSTTENNETVNENVVDDTSETSETTNDDNVAKDIQPVEATPVEETTEEETTITKYYGNLIYYIYPSWTVANSNGNGDMYKISSDFAINVNKIEHSSFSRVTSSNLQDAIDKYSGMGYTVTYSIQFGDYYGLTHESVNNSNHFITLEIDDDGFSTLCAFVVVSRDFTSEEREFIYDYFTYLDYNFD